MTFFFSLSEWSEEQISLSYVRGNLKACRKTQPAFRSFSKEAKNDFSKMQFRYLLVSPLAGSAFYHMTLFPLSDWLDDQVSALWDAGVCKKAKKPKNAVSVFCRFGIL